MEKIIDFRYGHYILSVRYPSEEQDFAVVTMKDLSQLRFPVIWSSPMTKSQANGAIELFKQIGFYDCPLAIEVA
jgi:hypothetical protein